MFTIKIRIFGMCAERKKIRIERGVVSWPSKVAPYSEFQGHANFSLLVPLSSKVGGRDDFRAPIASINGAIAGGSSLSSIEFINIDHLAKVRAP